MDAKDKINNKVIEYLQQVEILAEDILAGRSEIIELNKKRDKNREAIRQLFILKYFLNQRVFLLLFNF